MGHTFTNNLYHIVFSTKLRQTFLRGEARERIIRYICGIMKNRGGMPLCVNAVEDHMHMLVKIHPDMAVAKFVGEVKGNASKWISETFPELKEFAWQSGYSCFTVSESVKESVAAYIADQEAHHRKRSFAEELALLLDKNGVVYDRAHYLD